MTDLGKILIADDFHPLLIEELQAAGLQFSYQPDINREDILTALKEGASGLVIRSKTPVDKELILAGKSLQFIGRGGSGMDNIDEEFASKMGIACFNAARANADAVGEHTVGMLLALMHNLARADMQVKKRLWLREENRGSEIGGKTVGIIGFGHTGSAVARKLSGFNMRILAYDKYKSGFGGNGVEETDLMTIQQECDIITLHVPLTQETKFMINSEFLQNCVRKIVLLNLSRGKVVKTADVAVAIEKNHIAGFAADVLECEDFNRFGEDENKWFTVLQNHPACLLAPHIGGWTKESYLRISQVLASEIVAFCQR